MEARRSLKLDTNSSLDPEDWLAFRQVAVQALDDGIELLSTIRDRDVWKSVPPEVRARLERDLPEEPTPLEEVYEDLRRDILPFPTGNIHPRFWGWVMGTGTADGMVAEIAASAMNAHAGGYDQSATLVERQVLRWMTDVFGYPATAGGLLVSGGTEANINGVTVARNTCLDWDVRELGVGAGSDIAIYGSEQTHSWIYKCCEQLGLGRRAFRPIRAGSDHRIDLADLRRRVKEDRGAGVHPLCLVGNAGTVNTGAVDPLDLLADFAKEEDLWFHVDGALGGLAVLSEELAPRLRGIERADSIAFDLHKWGYMQYELGCVLVRSGRAQQEAFESTASYLTPPGRGIQPESLEFAQRGVQLSRGFRALRAWVALRTHGSRRIGAAIQRNVEQIQRFKERIHRHPELERIGPADLNVVCFRYVTPGRSGDELDTLNREILLRIQESGFAIPSSTVLEGKFLLRCANTNHRSADSDFEGLADHVVRLGRELAEAQEKL